jgi:hypothetical protein
MGGDKLDDGKRRWDLLPWRELGMVVDALTYGARKYSHNGWKGVSEDRYRAALMRHLSAYFSGERADRESGLHHLAHAGCCLLFIMWHDNGGSDDEV